MPRVTDNPTSRITFSSGWVISIDLLRQVNPSIIELAGCVHLKPQQVAEELDAWATGIGLPYGVNVNVEDLTYECVPANNHEGARRDVEDDA